MMEENKREVSGQELKDTVKEVRVMADFKDYKRLNSRGLLIIAGQSSENQNAAGNVSEIVDLPRYAWYNHSVRLVFYGDGRTVYPLSVYGRGIFYNIVDFLCPTWYNLFVGRLAGAEQRK